MKKLSLFLDKENAKQHKGVVSLLHLEQNCLLFHTVLTTQTPLGIHLVPIQSQNQCVHLYRWSSPTTPYQHIIADVGSGEENYVY